MRLIGLTGPISSGKTTVAELLAGTHLVRAEGWCSLADLDVPRADPLDTGGVELSFADPIKEFLLGLGAPALALWGASEHRGHPFGDSTVRVALQHLGTEWGRATAPDIWVQALFARVREALAWYERPIQPESEHFGASWTRRPTVHRVVISDVRFDNEAEAIRRRGGQVWHIERTRELATAGQHASEKGVTRVDGDVTIVNNGPLDVLMSRVRALL